MTVTKENGGYTIEAIVTSETRPKTYMSSFWRESMRYMYYTKEEAIAEFKKHLINNMYEEVK